MAIKGGAIITTGNGATVIQRIQTAGPGQVNIPTEKIYELGNYKCVATVRDTPDLTFSYESFDASCRTEALLTGQYVGRNVTDADVVGDTVTSATAVFVTADVGRTVIIDGAGVDGAEFVGTVESRTSATVAVLTEAVTTNINDTGMRITQPGYDLAVCRPIDIASQFKAGRDADDPFDVVASVAVPFLTLEQMSYKFGLKDNTSQTGQFRGDTIFYNPGPVFVETVAGSGVADQDVVTAHPAYQSAESDQRRVLAVTVGARRLALGADYSEAYGSIVAGAAVTTLTLEEAVPTTSTIRIIYASPDALSYPQTDDVHIPVAVLPAAIKGRDIDIYIGGYDPNVPPSAQTNRVTGIQSLTADWRVTLEKDEEFGNYYAVAQDFEVPTVGGSVDFMPRDPADLLSRLRQFAGIADATKVIGTATSDPLELDIVIRDPEAGHPIKRFHVDDARFTIPGFSGRIQQKTTVSITWESDEGDLLVHER